MNISSCSPDPLLAALTNPTELARRKGNVSRAYPLVDKTGGCGATRKPPIKPLRPATRPATNG